MLLQKYPLHFSHIYSIKKGGGCGGGRVEIMKPKGFILEDLNFTGELYVSTFIVYINHLVFHKKWNIPQRAKNTPKGNSILTQDHGMPLFHIIDRWINLKSMADESKFLIRIL